MSAAHRRIWTGEHKAYVCSTCRVDPADVPEDVAAEYGTDLPAAWEDCYADEAEVECEGCGDREHGPWAARIEDGALLCAACLAGE